MNCVNSISNSMCVAALEYNMKSNTKLLVQRLTTPIQNIFDKMANKIINEQLGKSVDSEDEILVAISDAFAEPFTYEQINRVYERSTYHSVGIVKSIDQFKYVQSKYAEPMAIENILFEIVLAHRHLMLWSKECEDQEFDAEMDILNLQNHVNNNKISTSKKNAEKQEAMRTLMLEFIELCLFETKQKFIDRTGLFYARAPSIYESDQFIVQQQQIIAAAIETTLLVMCNRTYAMASIVPFRRVIAPTAVLQQIFEQQQHRNSSVVSSSSLSSASSSSSTANNNNNEMNIKLLKQLLEETKNNKLDTIQAIDSVATNVEHVQLQLQDSTKILKNTHDLHYKHANNVEEELHTLVQQAEMFQRRALNHNHQIVQQQSQQPHAPAMIYVTAPSQQQNAMKSREGEVEGALYDYRSVASEQKHNQ